MYEARRSLNGNWGLAVGTTVMFLLLLGLVPEIIDLIIPFAGTIIYTILVSGPLVLGLSIFSLSLSRNQNTKFELIFDGFKKFDVSLGAYFLTTIFTLLWSLLLIIPGIIAAYSYSMTYYIIADNDSIGTLDAINESKRMMRSNKKKLFFLDCRLVGWLLLAIVTCGIGFLWYAPYYNVCHAKFYDNLKKGNTKKVPTVQKISTKKLKKTTEASKTGADEISGELKKYKQMLSDGLITQSDYNAKKKKILGI